MFIVLLKYLKPLEMVDQYIFEHRQFLERYYQKNAFVASGPQNPRTGGVIISQLKDVAQLEAILNEDPFKIHQIAEYSIIEFDPVKYHENFSAFINNN